MLSPLRGCKNLSTCFHFGVLAIPFICVASIVAEEPETRLPAVVVSATRLPDREFDAYSLPAKITVITKEEMERSGARTVQEALQTQPGIVLYDSIGNSHQQTFDMRGFNTQPISGTSVFVDGVRVNEPDFNQINFHLIPIEQIERIEIIPGSSAIFGRNSLAGAVNIITRRGGTESKNSVSASYGSFNRQLYTINSGGPLGEKLDYQMGVSRELTDGFRDDSEARLTRFFGKWGWQVSDTADLQISYTHTNSFLKQAGSIPSTSASQNPQQNITPGDFLDSDLDRVVFNGRLEPGAGFTLSGNLFYRDHVREARIIGLNSTTEAVIDTVSAGTVLQATHEADLADHLNVFIAGFEFTNNHLDSVATNVFGGFAFPSSRLTSENILSLYVQDSFDLLPSLVITGSVRYDSDKLEFNDRALNANSGRNFDEVTPRAGLVYKVIENLNLFASYSEGFQTPTIDQLFAFAGTSNPDLRPVKTKNYEVGIRGHVKWLQGALTFFHIDGNDEIAFNPSAPPFGQNQNLEDTVRRGIEFELRARPWEKVGGYLNYSYIDATFDSEFTLSSGVDFSNSTIRKGDRIPLVPRHRLGMGINVTPAKAWSISLNGRYQSDMVLVGDEGNDFTGLGGYFVMGAKVSYTREVRHGKLSAFVGVKNLLDREYSSFGIFAGSAEPFVVPGEEISLMGGVQFEF